MAAALVEYGRHGWAGFSIRGVAQAAHVGKSSMYLRWDSKEELLVDSVVAGAKKLLVDADTGTLYGDVMAWATTLFEYFLDPAGWTAARIWIDAKAGTAALDGITARVTTPITDMSTAIFQRALARGDLPEAVQPFDVAECLFGSIFMHVMNLPAAEHEEARRYATEHIRPLVHIVLKGIGATFPASPIFRSDWV
jgi:AcrR family transcriptional regulator